MPSSQIELNTVNSWPAMRLVLTLHINGYTREFIIVSALDLCIMPLFLSMGNNLRFFERSRMTKRVNREDHWMTTAEMNKVIKRKAFSSPGPEIEVLEKDQRRRNLETTVSGEHQCWFCTDIGLFLLWLCTYDAQELFSYFSCLHICFCTSQLLK